MRISEYFDQRAQGYAAALSTLGSSRALDAVVFRIILRMLNATNGTAIDMFCGTGFLGECLNDLFGQLYGVDASQAMIGHASVNAREVFLISNEEDAPTIPQKLLGREPNVIVSLGGLHHWFTEGESIDCDVNSIQLKTVIQWADAVGCDGLVILADVTHQHSLPYFKDDLRQSVDSQSITGCKLLSQMARNCPASEKLCTTIAAAGSISEYLFALRDVQPLCLSCSPASFFEEIVSKECTYGHKHRFLKPTQFVRELSKHGLLVNFMELPTPWFFPNRGLAETFLSKLFEIPRAAASDGIDKYLHIQDLLNGVAIGWRLGFYIIRRAPKPTP